MLKFCFLETLQVEFAKKERDQGSIKEIYGTLFLQEEPGRYIFKKKKNGKRLPNTLIVNINFQTPLFEVNKMKCMKQFLSRRLLGGIGGRAWRAVYEFVVSLKSQYQLLQTKRKNIESN